MRKKDEYKLWQKAASIQNVLPHERIVNSRCPQCGDLPECHFLPTAKQRYGKDITKNGVAVIPVELVCQCGAGDRVCLINASEFNELAAKGLIKEMVRA